MITAVLGWFTSKPQRILALLGTIGLVLLVVEVISWRAERDQALAEVKTLETNLEIATGNLRLAQVALQEAQTTARREIVVTRVVTQTQSEIANAQDLEALVNAWNRGVECLRDPQCADVNAANPASGGVETTLPTPSDDAGSRPTAGFVRRSSLLCQP